MGGDEEPFVTEISEKLGRVAALARSLSPKPTLAVRFSGAFRPSFSQGRANVPGSRSLGVALIVVASGMVIRETLLTSLKDRSSLSNLLGLCGDRDHRRGDARRSAGDCHRGANDDPADRRPHQSRGLDDARDISR